MLAGAVGHTWNPSYQEAEVKVNEKQKDWGSGSSGRALAYQV
jgi:hypothetical protein